MAHWASTLKRVVRSFLLLYGEIFGSNYFKFKEQIEKNLIDSMTRELINLYVMLIDFPDIYYLLLGVIIVKKKSTK